ncbi:hypothetical protein DSM110093_01967 [Sulfitobacter sp. DSM 110093]|uniref:ParB/RepB/Spo0J family partition protein n=1 Tax=Sulfitobacter sp. DSM 110093 TaxID=2883127 RepID=UPI001FADABBB|nr:ParB/RepB/Spo0J family partition protein [Sulfitobacter sp. DSM 110093]UOA32183.1 hypothetical protein DSM110093_01967 [Sulfitobacter sp. DSM 110093]
MNKIKQGLTREKTTQVKLSDISTDTRTFQFRDEDLNEAHAEELKSHIRRGEPLDPISVWRHPETQALIVVDGHHRLEAYRRFGWRGKVPAMVYTCSLEEARKLALKENAKSRLPMTSQERMNAVWNLNCFHDANGPVYSKKEIVALRLASDGTVAKMRRTRQELIAAGESLPNTWLEAMEMLSGRGQSDKDWDADAWVQARADAIDAQVGKIIGYEGERCLDALRVVLEKRLGHRTEELADYWRVDDLADGESPF